MIKCENLTKKFRIYSSPGDRIREAIFLGKRTYHAQFTALKDINLVVEPGRTVGLIGQNGSGKSTLLKIIGRLMVPTSGRVEVQGRVASIIELGTGFHPEFTGRSNIYMTASLMGYTREEIDRIFPLIVQFSGLERFIDRPVKTYSSGMWVRLAFSTAVAVEPAVLLIDEALSVGDLLFQQKCVARLREFQEKGTTILFVSHDLGAVKTLCDEAILLEKGRKRAAGTPEAVCSQYSAMIAEQTSRERLETRVDAAHRRYGSYRAEIEQVEFLSQEGRITESVVSGEPVVIEVSIKVSNKIEDPSVGILIRDRLGNDIFGSNTFMMGIRIPTGLRSWKARFEFPMDLGPGRYSLTAAVHSGRDHFERCYDWIDHAATFEVLPTVPNFTGCARLRPVVSVTSGDRLVASTD